MHMRAANFVSLCVQNVKYAVVGSSYLHGPLLYFCHTTAPRSRAPKVQYERFQYRIQKLRKTVQAGFFSEQFLFPYPGEVRIKKKGSR